MSDKNNLRLDWCSHEAAKYAVINWHYSKTMPMPPWNAIGVWENNVFIGSILFGRGASPNLGNPYKCKNTQVAELLRVALTDHEFSVTRMIAIAIRMISSRNPGLMILVSFADTNEGHHGGIYQGGGWLYSGKTLTKTHFKDKSGRLWHSRQATATGSTMQFGTRSACAKRSECARVELMGKHRYLMPLNEAMRKQIEPLRKPYPKRGTGETDNAAHSHAQTGGASPTVPLLNHGS